MAGEYVNCFPSENYYPDCNVIVIADSRGHHLDTYLSEILQCNFRIVTCRGADLLNSVRRSKWHLINENWSQIYCIAGICSLTRKDRLTRRVVLKSLNAEAAATDYSHDIEQAELEIRSYIKNTSTKIVFGTITGMSLCTYNRCYETPHRKNVQNILNSTVRLVNKEIIKWNERNSVSTPWLGKLVHRRHRNTFMNSYHRLQADGCHLTPEICKSWAVALKTAITNNMVTI